MILDQVENVIKQLSKDISCCISVFAGRIADTGRDPLPLMKQSLHMLKTRPKAELIWASPRQLFNIYDADAIGCHIITATASILNKLSQIGYDLNRDATQSTSFSYGVKERIALYCPTLHSVLHDNF